MTGKKKDLVVSVFDVGHYIESKNIHGLTRTSQSLLAYLAHAYHLGIVGEPLFEEPVWAWKSCVVTEISKFAQSSPDGPAIGGFDAPGNALNLSKNHRLVVDDIVRIFGEWNTEQLMRASQDLSWRKARKEVENASKPVKLWQSSGPGVISTDAICDEYSRKVKQ